MVNNPFNNNVLNTRWLGITVGTLLYKVSYLFNNNSVILFSPLASSIVKVVILLAVLSLFTSFENSVLLETFSANFCF